MSLPIKAIFKQSEWENFLSRPKKCNFHSPFYGFWLTMTSQMESNRSTQYTPMYEKEKFECESSQWRLLAGTTVTDVHVGFCC